MSVRLGLSWWRLAASLRVHGWSCEHLAMRFMVLCLCFAFAVPTTALGAPRSKKEAAEAKLLFETGKKAYNVGDFAKSIADWKKGYELSGDALFLFNMAQAHRQLKQYEPALFLYRAYLRELPNAPNSADVQQRIEQLEQLLAKAQQPPNEAITPPATPDDPAHEEVEEEEEPEVAPPPAIADTPASGRRPGRGKKLAGLIIAGGGVALLATGIVFTLSASSKADELEQASKAGEEWTDERQSTFDTMESQSTIGGVMIAVGAVGIVGGGVLYFMGRREARNVSLAAGPRDVRLAYAVSF